MIGPILRANKTGKLIGFCIKQEIWLDVSGKSRGSQSRKGQFLKYRTPKVVRSKGAELDYMLDYFSIVSCDTN